MKNWGKILALFLLLTLLGSSFFSCRSAESNPPKDDAEDRQEEEDFPRTGKDNIAVCIDAGHGFGDVGCGPAYIGAYEYEITIRVAQLLRDKLTEVPFPPQKKSPNWRTSIVFPISRKI